MSQAVYEGHRTYRIRGVGVAALVAVGLAAVALVVVAALFWALTISLEQAGDTGSLDTARTLERLTVLATLALSFAQFVALTLTVVWLWRARKNLDAFPETQPFLSAGWAIGAWFLPIANLVLPGRLMTNVARQSSRDRSVTAGAVVWWLTLVVSMLAYRIASTVAENRLVSADTTLLTDYYGDWAVIDTVAAAAGVVAAAAFGFTVLRISAAQEERIHRGWYEEQVRVMGVTPAPSAPEPGGSATIGA